MAIRIWLGFALFLKYPDLFPGMHTSGAHATLLKYFCDAHWLCACDKMPHVSNPDF
jgi:hypothetical protein